VVKPLVLLLALPLVLSAELRVGRAALPITPPLGAPMGNSYGMTPAAGIHDDIFAKALVLEVDGRRAALVACDLISLRREIVAETRRLIEQSTSLRAGQVILSATHCHAGPQMHPRFLALVGGEAERLGREYAASLPRRIAEAVRLAETDLQPARVWAARVQEHGLAFNRRFLMKDGTVRMNPGRRNPDTVRPVGPTDPDVSVVYFDTPEGRPLAAHVNFALHVAVVGGNQISSDFPGVLSRLLRDAKAPDMVTVFTNGMSGNVNHVNVEARSELRGYAEAARIGTILAARVLQAYDRLEPITPASLRAETRPVELPVPSFSAAEAEKAAATFSRYGKPGGPPFLDVVHAWKVLDVAALDGRPLPTEVQVMALGDQLAWVGMPGDAFVELGLAVKRSSPYLYTIVSEQSGSGAISYVPNRKAFPEGHYEVISARFRPGGAELLADTAIRLLTEIRR
jgi:hypothetical protein